MEENQDLVEKYMGTVSDGFVMVIGAIIIPIAFVAFLPLWLIGKVGQKMMNVKRVIQ